MNRRSSFVIAVAVAATLAIAGPASAADFANGGFENGGFEGGGFQTLDAGTASAGAINGWTVTSGDVDWIAWYWNAEEGAMSLDLNGLDAGAISQTFDTQAGHTYRVTFWQSGSPVCGGGIKTLQVS